MKNPPDDEEKEMLDILPDEPKNHGGYFKIPAANCYVCKDSLGRIGIYPDQGGWIGAKIEHFEADVAPFHG